MDPERFSTCSLTDPRLKRILAAALRAVDPAQAVRQHLPPVSGSVYGLGIGKASIPMLTALAEAIPLSGALAISKHASPLDHSPFPVLLGGHPIPNLHSLRAGEAALKFVSALGKDDTLICLISGGGSALMTAPLVPLEDLQTLTSLLLACGARIDEINTLRRRLDRVKGGGLARATSANVISLILSDVIGNRLEAIASGPTFPDPAAPDAALAILRKYRLEKQIPPSIRNHLLNPSSSPLPANDDDWSKRVKNIIIGDNSMAARAAMEQAQREGFNAEILTSELQGEAREAGRMLAQRLKDELTQRTRPFCLIAGGETTVTLRGNGKGGRNQELALAAAQELRGLENAMLIALATDGEDGPTDASGAVVSGKTFERGARLGLDAADYLSRNDAYHYFEALGDLLRSGPSGTNVNDLVFLCGM
jgi:hydroxypyruvate reductase